MNPTNIWNLIKSGLLALGVSSSVIGYISDEVGIAVGGAVIAIGAAIWQVIALKTTKLIEAVAKDPEVSKVVVHNPELAEAIPSPKVVAPLT